MSESESKPTLAEVPVESRLTIVQRELNAAKSGSRSVSIAGKQISVPDDCSDGFGTWHPRKSECVSCPHIPLCFCKATDTEPYIIEVAKTKRREQRTAVMSEASEQGVSKIINPYRKNSRDFAGRNLFIEILRIGKAEFDTAELEKIAEAAKIERKKPAETHPNYFNRLILKMSKAHHEKGAPKGAEAFYGCVTAEGKKPNYKFKVDIKAARAAYDKLKAEADAKRKEREEKRAAKAAKEAEEGEDDDD